MPISRRLVINLTIVLLTVGLLALVGIIATTVWLGEKAQIYAEEATTARNTAVELRAALQNAESSQRGYLVGGNEIYLAPYDSAKAQAASQLMNLKSSRSTSSQTVRLMERLSQLVSEKIDDDWKANRNQPPASGPLITTLPSSELDSTKEEEAREEDSLSRPHFEPLDSQAKVVLGRVEAQMP
jgi:Tfp pilus assembly protein PilV